MRQQESVPAPRGWTRGAAWKGTGASLLLHLVVGAAVIVALSGPPKAPMRVVDLTLLPPAEIDRRPVPPAFAAVEPARDPGTAVLPEPPAIHAPAAVANPPDATASASPSDPAVLSFACRTIFSTTTIASSTRMPIEKISANSVMRLSV